MEGSGIIVVKHSRPQGAHSGGAQGRHTKKSDCNKCPNRCKNLISEANIFLWGLDLILASSTAPFIAFSIPFHEPRARVKQAAAHEPNPDLCLIFVNKVHWNTAMFVWLHMVSGCFHTTKAELSGCNKTQWPTKPRIFTHWLFITSLPTSSFWEVLDPVISERCNRTQEKQLKWPWDWSGRTQPRLFPTAYTRSRLPTTCHETPHNATRVFYISPSCPAHSSTIQSGFCL